MRKVFLASHGGLAMGAKTSIEMIIGEQEYLKAYSLQPGGSAADFAAEIEQEILAEPENEFIILTDLYGASVCNAMMPLSAHENTKVFSGLNLGMALEVLTADPEPFTEEALEEIVADVRMGVQQVKMEAVEEEDF